MSESCKKMLSVSNKMNDFSENGALFLIRTNESSKIVHEFLIK